MIAPVRSTTRAGLAAALAAALAGCGGGPDRQSAGDPAHPATIRVKVAAVERRSFPASFSASGTLGEGPRTTVVAPAGGYVGEVAVTAGQAVRRGDLLFTIGGDEDRAAVAAAEGELARARLVLAAGGDPDDPALVIAGERAAAAERTIAEAGETSARARATAPFDGVVAAWLRGAGEQVGEGEPVIELARSDLLAAVVGVTAEQVKDIAIGLVADIAVPPFGRRPGAVVAIEAPAGESGEREVRIEVGNHDRRLQAGLPCEVTLPMPGEVAEACVPVAALLGEGERRYLFVVQDRKARRRDVSAGAIAGGCVAAGDDVEEGERVVVGGAAGLTDGATVQVDP